MTEHELQNLIRLHISENKLGTMFRANVGSGWTGTVHKSSARSVTIYGARRFSTGLPAGFPDLFGFRTITVTPGMVGKEIAVFAELKSRNRTERCARYSGTCLTICRSGEPRGNRPVL